MRSFILLTLIFCIAMPSYAQNEIRLIEIETLGRGSIRDLAWSGNGAYLAVASSTGVYVHTATDWAAPPQRITEHASYQVEWQTNQLVGLTDRNELRRWEINTDGMQTLSITQPLNEWSRNKKFNLVVLENDVVLAQRYPYSRKTCEQCLWSSAKRGFLTETQDFETFYDRDNYALVAFFPDMLKGSLITGESNTYNWLEYYRDSAGDIIRLSSWDNLKNLSTDEESYRLEDFFVRLSPKANYFLSLTERANETDTFLHLYSLASNEKIVDLAGRLSEDPRFAEFTLDEQHLAVSDGATLMIWDLATGALEGQIAGYGGEVNEITISPDGGYFISSHSQNLESRASQIWSFTEDEPVGTFIGTAPYAWLEEDVLFAGTYPFAIKGSDFISDYASFASVWDLSVLTHPAELPFPWEVSDGILNAVYLPENQLLVLGERDDRERSFLILSYPNYELVDLAMTFDRENPLIADQNYVVFDNEFSSKIFAVENLSAAYGDQTEKLVFWEYQSITTPVISPNSQVFARADILNYGNYGERREETLEIYDLSDLNDEPVFAQNYFDLNISNLVFSHDSRYLAMTASVRYGDTYFYLFDTTTWQIIYLKQFSSERMNTITFTPDGRYLLEGTQDGLIHIWELGR